MSKYTSPAKNNIVREPNINECYKTKLVQIIKDQPYRPWYDEDQESPDPVILDKTHVDTISKYNAEGYSIRLYVDDNQIRVEASKSYLDTVAYNLAVAEYHRLLPD